MKNDGSYTKTPLKDELLHGLLEHTYLIREIWYKRPNCDQNIQLREIEAEYPDGDLHHYFVVKAIDQDIPDDWKMKYSNCKVCRPKVMEFLFRYYQTIYNEIAYQTEIDYFSSCSVLFCNRKSNGKFIRHSKSPFFDKEASDMEDRIISCRSEGLFPTQYTDPHQNKEAFENEIMEMEKLLQDAYN
eukprot:NODE_791_length_4216_cov_0.181686.p3 type:complete len:186 gc:universal NODE_791_length_4216_cov_0.181686:95-652(+)